jgi:hypothetical protein
MSFKRPVRQQTNEPCRVEVLAESLKAGDGDPKTLGPHCADGYLGAIDRNLPLALDLDLPIALVTEVLCLPPAMLGEHLRRLWSAVARSGARPQFGRWSRLQNQK